MNKFILQIFIFLCFGADSDLFSQCNSTELLNIDKVVTNSRTGSSCNHTAQIDLLVNSKGNASACLVYTSGGAEKKICWNGGTTLSNHLVTFDADCNTSISLIAFPNPTGGGSPCSGPTAPTSFSTILPVEYVTFAATPQNDKIKLEWSTASETNNDYFTIERSGDGRIFDAIGIIDGAGNSSDELYYEFKDESPLQGINYYRINQTDFDGQYSYSEIRSVRHNGAGKIAISPRHTDGRLDINTEMKSYDVAAYSSTGQEVSRFVALSGHQSVSIESLQAGIYFIKVASGSVSETIKIVKY
jgi:hypothetical protein